MEHDFHKFIRKTRPIVNFRLC